MCGIYGYFSKDVNKVKDSVIKSMGDSIRYRGPDDSAFFNGDGVALGNNRLAILDVDHGKQPFFSDDGKIVVVQNGEIFNHMEIAAELKGTKFECMTSCDTEVILRLYERDGIDFISQLNGMFAIAIYDKNKDECFLIRDRVGEKPLFYFYDSEKIVFGSEIKAIFPFGITPKLNYDAIDSFLTLNYVVPPITMFDDIYHVLPGTYIKIDRLDMKVIEWWDLSSTQVLDKSEDEWVDLFNENLHDSVKLRLRADVPFGAFLSGGVDSTTVIGIMSKYLKNPVKTFCIGFNNPLYDESEFAELASVRFKTEHHMERVESNLLAYWPKVTYHCDQPHGDVSFMPTYKVAELASASVKMVLTGDGADELFAGYDKYKNFFNSEILSLDDDTFKRKYIENISLFNFEDKKELYSEVFKSNLDVDVTAEILDKNFSKVAHMDRLNQALYIDTMLLLSGNNLVKPDRMGMAVSIENRSPFLDYRLIELAFSMPGSMKIKNGETKYIYKKAVKGLIGDSLAYRKKQMFTVPIGDWLKHELKDMVFDLLFSEFSCSKKLFNQIKVEKMYNEHCNGTNNYTREIRALMALEIWFREFNFSIK